MWHFQHGVDVTVIPSIFNESGGGITELLKERGKLWGVFDWEMGINWVLEALNLMRFWEILLKSEFKVEVVSRQDADRVREERTNWRMLRNAVSHQHESILLFVEEKKSLIKCRKRVGGKTKPWGTLLFKEKGEEADPINNHRDRSSREKARYKRTKCGRKAKRREVGDEIPMPHPVKSFRYVKGNYIGFPKIF